MTQCNTPFLTFHEVTFSCPNIVISAQPISFMVEEGECVGITGLNNQNSSLLLSLAAGLIPFSSGQILLNQLPIVTSPMMIGCLIHPYLFQTPKHSVPYQKQLFLINHAAASFCRISFSNERSTINSDSLVEKLLDQADLLLLEEPAISSGFTHFIKNHKTILFTFSKDSQIKFSSIADRVIDLKQIEELENSL